MLSCCPEKLLAVMSNAWALVDVGVGVKEAAPPARGVDVKWPNKEPVPGKHGD